MKKKTHLIVASLLLLACLVTGGLGTTPAFADVSYTPQNGYTTTNVARGKLTEYKDVDGNVIPEEQLVSLHGNYGSSFNPYTALTNGDNASGGGHNIVLVKAPDLQGELRTFAYLDLEQEYTVNEFALNFWNDHSFIEVVVQIAKSADFSDAVTIYNNDTANEMKCGAGSDPTWKDTPNRATHYSFPAVRGRYVRVSGRDTQGGARFTEIEVYGVTSGMAPVAGNMVREKQSGSSSLALSSEIAGAAIYYTTDGSIPTENSTPYTAPIALSGLDANKVCIRAVAVKDGVATVPSDFKFDVSAPSRNLALGLTPTFDEGMEPVSHWGSEATLSMITDGVTNPFNVMGSVTPGWMYLDLGAEYRIDRVDAKFYHDWAHAAAIQLSTTANFTEDTTYTVYSNYGVNGASFWTVERIPATSAEWYYGEKSFTFKPVIARYVRVYNKNNQRNSSGWEEVRVWSAVVPDALHEMPAENVLLGKTPTVPDGITINNGHFITDGTCGSFHNFASLSGTNWDKTWLTFDFGKEYTVDTIKTKFYNDHSYRVILQLATDAAFTQNVHTVFNSDTDNTMGVDAGTDTYKDVGAAGDYTIGNHLVECTFEPVVARYFRVHARSKNEENTRFEELQVWTKAVAGQEVPEEHYPVTPSAIIKASGIGNFSVPNGATKEYFADKLPAPLAVEDYFGNEGTVAGTWACADYDATTQGEYTFTFTPASANWVDLYNILTVKVTVAAAADKTDLAALVVTAQGLQQADYVSSSWTALAEPLAAAVQVNNKTLVLQSEVDKALADLQAAINGLKLLGDKTDLSALLATISELTQADYSAASWQALQTKVTDANAVVANTDVTQTVVDLALADLQAAYNALQKIGSKNALQTRYDAVKDTQNIYTKATWASFAAALADAKAVLDKEEAYENELTAALAKLDSTYAALAEKADFTALNTAIAEVEELDLSAYTANSVAALNESLTAAKAVAENDESTQEAINAALADLTTEKGALTQKGNKTELNTLLASCNYAQDRYTASTYNAYVTAKQQAEAVSASENATQTEIDAAKTALGEKVAALRERGDKNELLAAIATAEGIEKGKYSDESYKAFTDALAYAKSVAESNDVEQSAIDEAREMLTQKQAALAQRKGCGSSVSVAGSMIAALALLCAAAVVLAKKTKKEQA